MAYGRAEILNVVNPDPTAPTLIIPTTWTPSAILANLLFWYKADVGVTSASGQISAIADQSGVGLPLAQSVAANQLTLVNNAQNSMPMMQSGVTVTGGYYMQAATARAATQFAVAQPWTLAIAFRHLPNGGAPGNRAILAGSVSGNFIRGWLGGISINKLFCGKGQNYSPETAAFGIGSTSLVAQGNYAAVFTDNGSGKAAGMQAYLNGAPETMTALVDNLTTITVDPGQVDCASVYSASGAYTPRCGYFEWFAANRILTSMEIRQATSYLRQRWNF